MYHIFYYEPMSAFCVLDTKRRCWLVNTQDSSLYANNLKKLSTETKTNITVPAHFSLQEYIQEYLENRQHKTIAVTSSLEDFITDHPELTL